jgi:hypothetical protein
MNSATKSGELLQPMLDLFGGTDGGVAFALLRHTYLSQCLDEPEKYNEVIKSFEAVSLICKRILELK